MPDENDPNTFAPLLNENWRDSNKVMVARARLASATVRGRRAVGWRYVPARDGYEARGG